MTDPKTLARTENPQTSKDAAKKMVESGALSRQENEVYDYMIRFIKQYGNPMNFTTKEIALYMDDCPSCKYPYWRAYDICRKRFSGLENKGKIEPIQRTVNVLGEEYKVAITKNGKPAYERRDGCQVWRLL